MEEAPLRFVDDPSHGTPWHELAESSGFKAALKNIPDFRDKVFDLANSAITRSKPSKSKDREETVQQVQSADS